MTLLKIISHNFKTTKQQGQSEIENLNDNHFNHFNAQNPHICKTFHKTYVNLQFLFNLHL
jgi:hypothetical protein